MFLYSITLVPLSEELQAADPGILTPFYADDVAFDRSTRRSAELLKMLMERGSDWGYFTKTSKLLFTADTPGQKDSDKREFAAEGPDLYFV